MCLSDVSNENSNRSRETNRIDPFMHVRDNTHLLQSNNACILYIERDSSKFYALSFLDTASAGIRSPRDCDLKTRYNEQLGIEGGLPAPTAHLALMRSRERDEQV